MVVSGNPKLPAPSIQVNRRIGQSEILPSPEPRSPGVEKGPRIRTRSEVRHPLSDRHARVFAFRPSVLSTPQPMLDVRS